MRDIDHDEAMCNAATKEPWQARQIVRTVGPMQVQASGGWELLGMTEDGMPLADWFERKEDAVFAAEAREALPWYIGEVRRLRRLIGDFVALLDSNEPVEVGCHCTHTGDAPVMCVWCRARRSWRWPGSDTV